MRRLQISLLGVTALVVLVGPGMVKNATADVRVEAILHTPNVSVRIGNTSSTYYRKPLPIQNVCRHVVITNQDRKIAKRLARYTGVPARELIALRGMGFSWTNIGRWLDLPHSTIRAAMNSGGWNHYLKHERLARGDTDRFEGHRVVYVDDRDFEDYDD